MEGEGEREDGKCVLSLKSVGQFLKSEVCEAKVLEGVRTQEKPYSALLPLTGTECRLILFTIFWNLNSLVCQR